MALSRLIDAAAWCVRLLLLDLARGRRGLGILGSKSSSCS